MTTLSLSQARTAPTQPTPSRLRAIARRKTLWIVLLAVGYWFATPYYLPWTAEEEASADSRAIAAQGSVERELAMPALALLAAYMLWRTRSLPKMSGYLFNAGVLYLLVEAVSIGWSTDPSVSVRRYIVFSMGVLLITALARVYTTLEIARIGYYVGGFAALFAFVVETMITHSFAPLDANYRFMGIMSSNYMAENLTVCFFSALTLVMHDPTRKWIARSLFIIALLLFITRSRTATIACLLFSSFFFKRIIDSKFRRERRVLVTLAVLGLAVGFVVAKGNLSELLQSGFMMGRNDTQNTASLSNRLPLWQELSEYVARRPYLGYGFRAFWTPDRIAIISAHQKWPVPNAHDTYLDEYISTGVLGTPLYIFIFWGGLFVAWRRYVKVPIAEHLFPAVMLSWLFFTSWVEAIPLDPFLPTTLAYVCMLKSMLPAQAVIAPIKPAATFRRKPGPIKPVTPQLS